MKQDIIVRQNSNELFWLQKLKNLEHKTIFPAIGENLASNAQRKVLELPFSPAFDLRLKEVCKNRTSSEYLILLAGLNILLLKYTGEEDWVIASSPVENGQADSLSFFRPKTSLETTGRQLLANLLQELKEIQQHSLFEFQQLEQRIEGNNALFQVGLHYEAYQQKSPLAAKIALLFNIERTAKGLALQLSFPEGTYSEKQALQLGRHYQQLLTEVLGNINAAVSDYNMLTAEDEAYLLQELNDTDQPFADQTIVEAFAETVKSFSGNTALCHEQGKLTYSELDVEATKLANYLHETCTVGKGDVVAILLEPGQWVVPSMLGILKSGAAYLPILPSLSKERIAFILADAGVKALVTDSMRMFEVIEYFQGHIIALDVQIGGMTNVTPLPLLNEAADNAYIIYTSGTTGKAKGVPISHRSLNNYVKHLQTDLKLDQNDSSALVSSHAFDLGYTGLWGALLSGAALHQVPEAWVKDTPQLVEYIVSEKIQFLKLTPSLLYMIRHSSNFNQLKNASLRLVLCGGEEIRPSDLQALKDLIPTITLVNHYGPTEGTIGCLTHVINDLQAFKERPVIGEPISNMRAYVLDEKLRPVGLGMSGNLFISGKGLTKGYLNRPELTAKTFTPHPFLAGETIYRTGDRARRRADGQIEYLGREDRQVKIRGYRIELQEIEDKLSAYFGVKRAAVMVMKDKDNLKFLKAFVEGISEEDLALLKWEMRKNLVDYKIPRDYIVLDEFPVTSNGKIDYKALKKIEVAQDSQSNYVAPSTEIEQKIVEIWEEILDKKRIGVHDNYFEIGGDSLKGIRVVNQLQEYLGEIVHVGVLFDAPTPAELAQRLTRSEESDGLNEEKIAEMRRIITPLAPFETKGPKNPRAVFILAPPRSGSTLLRIMLAGHPGLFAPPELQLLLFNTLEEREGVFQGRLGGYKEGSLRAMMELDNITAEEAQAQMDAHIAAGMSVKEFYGLIQSKLAGRLLVDKSPSYGRDMEIMKRGEAYFENAIYIHLQRHPYGLIHSYEDTRMDQIFRYKNDFTARELGELEWLVSHQNIENFLEGIPAGRKHQVKFEDLVNKPNEIMSNLCDFLGLNDVGNEMTEVYGDANNRMTDGLHEESKMIGDIKFFQHKKIDSAVAEKWRAAYETSFLYEETEEIAARFGYNTTIENTELEKIEDAENYEVSHAQKRLWILDQFEEGQFAYNQPRSYVLNGDLEENALVRAFEVLVERHEALRTVFQTVDGGLKQRVLSFEESGFQVERIDLGGVAEGMEKAMLIANEEGEKPFDLANGPLIRVKLIRLAASEYVLVMNTHHIVCDGWSIRILAEELHELYAAFKSGKENPLAALALQYRDYAHWQNQKLQGLQLAKHQNYWHKQFEGEIPVLDLPISLRRPEVQTFNGGKVDLNLGSGQLQQLKEISQKQGASLFMTLLATVNVLLYKYSAQEDIVIGTPTAGRNHQALEAQIGFYVNMLALRTQFSKEASFNSLLGQVKENTLGAYQHQVYPFDLLVDDLGLERDLGRSPLFDVMVTLANIDLGTEENPDLDGVKISALDNEFLVSKYDLTFTFSEDEGGLYLSLNYNTDIFDLASIKQLSGHYANLVAAIIENANATLTSLDFLAKEEKNQLLQAFNATSSPQVEVATLQEMFEAQATKNPTGTAVVFGKEKLTYSELNEKANQLAHYLRENCQIKPQDKVAFLLDCSQWHPVVLLGILKSGATYIPLDVSQPIDRINYILEETCPKELIVLDNSFDLDKLIDNQTVLELTEKWLEIANCSKENPKNRNKPTDLAYIIYTSGSTGKPKGVMVPQRGLVNTLSWRKDYYGFTAEHKHLQVFSYAFDGSVTDTYSSLVSGGVLVIPDPAQKKDINYLGEIIKENGVTHFIAVPSLYKLLLEEINEKLGSLVGVTLAGEATTDDILNLHGEILPQVGLYNEYGPTENSVCSTATKLKAGEPITIGQPIANVKAYILSETLELLPKGAVGEICLAGMGLADGYLGEPSLSKEKMIPNPFAEEGYARLYRTGDLGRWSAEGNIEFLGRKDNQVKIRGFRIELGEIEQTILQYEGAKQAVVVLRKEATKQELVAFVVTENGEEVEGLSNFLAEKMPEYMVPGSILWLAKFPVNTTGKIDRKALLQLETGKRKTNKRHPRNKTEQKLLALWQEILGQEDISIDDNFFNLGGHSIKAMQLTFRVFKEFGTKVVLRDVFKNPTIESLAACIKTLRPSIFEEIPQAPKQQYYPTSHAQKRLWILDQFEENQTAYNMCGSFTITGELDRAAFSQTFATLVERHEILRTRFVNQNGTPWQEVQPVAAFGFKLDYKQLEAGQKNTAHLDQLVRENNNTTFDLATGPLFKATLVEIGEEKHLLLLAMHHIVSDGWSMQVLEQEVLALYNALKNQAPNPLADLKIQYKDYAVWQQNQLTEEKLEEHESFWLDRFAGEIPVLELPLNFTRPPIKEFEGKRVSSALGKELSTKINQLCQHNEVTPFMFLLAAVKTLLYKYSGQEDIIVGTSLAGREHASLENQIGFYVNNLPLRTKFDSKKGFSELLGLVKETVLEASSHQVYPFDLLIEKLEIKRDMSTSPLFDVLVVLQNTEVEATTAGHTDLEISAYQQESTVSKFDLSFNFVETEEEGFVAKINYSTSLFEDWFVEKMLGHFTVLLGKILEEVKTPLATLQYLEAAERQKLLVDFNDTAASYQDEASIQSLFEAQVALNPDAVALVSKGKELSYGDLNEKADKLAEHLVATYNLRANDLVCVLMDRSEEMIISILAILKAAAAFVPIDTSYPDSRVKWIVENSGSKLVLSNSSQRVNWEMPTLFVDDFLNRMDEFNSSPLANVTNSEDLAYVIYTSGSTGTPKGCAIKHQSLVNYLDWAASSYFAEGVEGNFAFFTSISFDFTLTSIFCTLSRGKTLHIFDEETPIDKVLTACFDEGNLIDVIKLTPAHIGLLEQLNLSSTQIKLVIAGGEELTEKQVDVLKNIGDIRLVNEYGPTESTIGCIVKDIVAGEKILIGKPIANTQVYILDKDDNLLPPGIIGELCLGGDGLAVGYLGSNELTDEKFSSSPFKQGERIYRTGDLGRWTPDGEVDFLGRKDFMVKVRGFRVELGEIDNSLLKYEGIGHVVSMVRGEGNDKYIVTYFSSEKEINPSNLRIYLSELLPYYMIPSYFIWMPQFELNNNGKVDRSVLPNPEELDLRSQSYVPAETAIEATLVEIWEESLQISPIGVMDNFFELGGNSIQAIKLASEVSLKLNTELKLVDILSNSTIRNIAAYIEFSLNNGLEKIEVVPTQASYEMSHGQKRLWILNQLEENQIAYNIPAVYEIGEAMDQLALANAFDTIVARHEILRTTFDLIGEIPQQIVHPIDEFKIKVDFADLTAATNKEKSAKATANEEAQTVFDLLTGPLVKAKLVQLEKDHFLFFFTIHHIIADGWSMKVFEDELMEVYDAFKEGKSNPLPALKIQYKDYTAWQNKQLTGNKFTAHKEYWQGVFKDEIPVLEMPLSYQRPKVKTAEGHTINCLFAEEISNKVYEIGAKQQATLFMVMQAAVKGLLFKYTGQEDLVIGTPIAGRNHGSLARQIGFYVNTLALRTTFSANDSFTTLLEKVKEDTLGAYKHQIYPFDTLVDDLGGRKDMSRSPIFDVMLVSQNISTGEDDANNEVDMVSYTSMLNTSKFDLSFGFDKTAAGLKVRLTYNTSLFAPWYAEQILAQFQELVHSIVDDKAKPLGELNYLSSADQQKLLVDFNKTAQEYPATTCIQEFFETQAQEQPEATALVFEQVSWSYKTLNEKANQLAHYLREVQQVGRQDIVALVHAPSEKMILSILAVIKAGAAYLPIDPAAPQKRIQYQLADSQAKILIGEQSLLDQIGKFELPKIATEEVDGLIATHSKSNPALVNEATDLFYVIYTSGSTGMPKGVMMEHRSAANMLSALWKQFDFTTEDVVMLKAPYVFDVSVRDIFMPLCFGGRLVVCTQEVMQNPLLLIDAIEENGVTSAHFVPSMYHIFLDSIDKEALPKLRSLRQLITGGEALLPEILKKHYELFSIPLHNFYGPTETCVDVTAYTTNREDQVVPVGKAIANTQLYILNKNLGLQALGVPGEIGVAGAGLARGYLNRPELSKQKFIPHPFVAGERMYLTGDIGRMLPDGNIEFTGRKDFQVKVRGYRIELGEIENVLLGYKGIINGVAVVRGVGESNTLAAYYTSDSELDEEKIRTYFKNALPDYMIPTALLRLEKLPLTVSGKVDRKALPDFDHLFAAEIEYQAPSTVLEKQIVLFSQEILQVDQIGLTDNFFELGGNSIKAIRLAARISKELKINLVLVDVLSNPMVQELVAKVASKSTVENEAITKVQAQEYYNLSHVQKGVYLKAYFSDKKEGYNIWRSFEHEEVNENALEKAVYSLVERHENLRTIFVWNEGEPKLKVMEEFQAFAKVNYVDLDKEADLNKILRKAIHQPFDRENGPLFKTTLYRTEDGLLFTIVIDHIISDAWSLDVLENELYGLYQMHCGEGEKLAALDIQYKDYAAWQVDYLAGRKGQEAKAFWRNKLAGAPFPDISKRLKPVDFPPYRENLKLEASQYLKPMGEKELSLFNGNVSTLKSEAGMTYDLLIPKTTTEKLEKASGRLNASIFGLLCAGLYLQLARQTGKRDLVICERVSTRTGEQTNNLIGMFLNSVCFRTKVDEQQSLQDFVSQVQEEIRDSLAHKDYPFEQVLDDLGLPVEALCQIFVNYTDFQHSLAQDIEDFEPVHRHFPGMLYDLYFNFRVYKNALRFELEYNPTLFDKEFIETFVSNYLNLLDKMIEKSDEPIQVLLEL